MGIGLTIFVIMTIIIYNKVSREGENSMKAMKRILVATCLMIALLSSGCSSKSEYYIEKPKDDKFSMESVNKLQNSDVELIKEFLPKVTEWYNTIDISKEQTIDFVTDEINDLGHKLYESSVWTSYINNFLSGSATEDDKEKYQQIQRVNAIYGKIAEIMMTTEMTFSLSEESDVTMIISEDIWIELGDCIKEAIDYYYK